MKPSRSAEPIATFVPPAARGFEAVHSVMRVLLPLALLGSPTNALKASAGAGLIGSAGAERGRVG